MRRVLSAASVCAWVLACGGEPEALHPSVQTPASIVCLPEPVPSASIKFSPSKSELSVVVEVEDDRLQKLFDDVLPTTVAHDENVKAGVAGRASYVIERGDIALVAGADGMTGKTPLKGDIQLCKPLGAVCFGYGRCHPEWDAKIRVPQQFTRAHPPHVDFNLKLRKGCVLSPVRFDATSELEKITKQQEQKIEEQINRTVAKRFKQLVESLSDGLGVGKLESGECVGFKPEAAQLALQNSGSNDHRQYNVGVFVVGTATRGCEPIRLDSDFRVSVTESVPAQASFVLEEVVPFSDLEQALQVTSPGVKVSVTPSGPDVVVRVTPFGGCGVAWGRFAPEIGAAGFVLRPVQLSEPSLGPWVAQRGPLLHTRVARHQTAMNELSRRVSSPIEAANEVNPHWTLVVGATAATSRTTRVVSEGVVLGGQLQGEIRGQLRPSKH